MKNVRLLVLIPAVFWSCSSDPEPGLPDPCAGAGTEVAWSDLVAYDTGNAVEIPLEGYLEGVVVSADTDGNIYGSMYMQDALGSPQYGLEIKTDLSGVSAFYPPGSRVRLNLKGLYLGRHGDGLALGMPRDIFGSVALDRIPATELTARLSGACADGGIPEPRDLEVSQLEAAHLHTLVRLQGVEILPEYPGTTFAEPGVETEVPLIDCSGNRLRLLHSGYSDFVSDPLPPGSGSATGILTGKPGAFVLWIRSPEDLDFQLPGCEALFPPRLSDRILISEIADPDNTPDGRFLELYNASEAAFDLKNWSLVRYTNANTEPGKPADLSGYRIPAGGVLVCSADPEVFEALYGFAPDIILPANGPADSNGDDTIALLNPEGEIADIFGIPGEDGSGTSHEFEDGGAFRRSGIRHGNPVYTPAEWDVYNDTGAAGTQQEPLTAPDRFSPGRHPAGPAGKQAGSD